MNDLKDYLCFLKLHDFSLLIFEICELILVAFKIINKNAFMLYQIWSGGFNNMKNV